jgi:hypothetical protein
MTITRIFSQTKGNQSPWWKTSPGILYNEKVKTQTRTHHYAI